MKNVKNIACVVLAGILALGMCSCGKKKNSGKSADLSVKKGDTVTFGSYGGKKIEWIVKGKKNTRITVKAVSEKAGTAEKAIRL